MNRRNITAANGYADRQAGSTCTTGDNSGSGPDGKTALSGLAGANADCNTNTTGAIVALGLADCEAPELTVPKIECNARTVIVNNVSVPMTVANDDLAALERFLKSLTDPRVQCDKAPFDHPSLPLPTGHSGSDVNNDGRLDDITFTLPAVGSAGYSGSSAQFCMPNAGDLFAPGMQARSGGN
jgi:hypothetical protein